MAASPNIMQSESEAEKLFKEAQVNLLIPPFQKEISHDVPLPFLGILQTVTDSDSVSCFTLCYLLSVICYL